MAASYPTLRLPNGTTVAESHWAQLADNIDDLDARALAAVSTANALRADLGTWSGATAISRFGTLEGITGTGASSKFGSGVGTGSNVLSGSATAQLGDLRTRTTSVENRATALEGRGKGSWKASGGAQMFSHGVTANILINTAVGSPTGITNNGDGTWTVNQPGQWSFSLVFDLNFASAPPSGLQEWIISIIGPAGTIGAHQFAWPTTAFTAGSAAGSTYLTAGQVVSAKGVWWRSAGASGGPFSLADGDTSRATFNASCGPQ
ncbi:hypothetical protein [Amycolatopsis magusensis]|uniref:hypothetical protein n=1 Tax=Amycolatopsis magusensis TaxID=882444 RepID=UPI0037A8F6BA